MAFRYLLLLLFGVAAVKVTVGHEYCYNPDSVPCGQGLKPAGDMCYRELKEKYIGAAVEYCNSKNLTLLQVPNIPKFYRPLDLDCYGIEEGPYLVNALKVDAGLWTKIFPGVLKIGFSKFRMFNPYDCNNGSVLAWFPHERDHRHPYGTLKCHNPDHKLKSFCVDYNALVELVGGCDDSEGNLFAYNPTTKFYGPVCDDGWDSTAADVVCKQLGFGGVAETFDQSRFGLVPSDFSYDNVVCTGNEKTLDQCAHDNVDNCGDDEGAGMRCI